MSLSCQRALFNIPENVSYLNCATFGPLNKHSERAGIEALAIGRNPLQRKRKLFFEPVQEIRSLFAQLINDQIDNIAIIPSVSYGIAMVANNILLEKNDEVLVLEDQFPSNFYTWSKRCNQVGANLKIVKSPNSISKSRDWNTKILDRINAQTKVVAMGQVHWMDGTYFDLKRIREKCDLYGAYLIIDGTQSVGALPFDCKSIRPDALLVAGYKWMLGTYGLGFAYIGPRLRDGEPLEENWINRKRSGDFENLTQYTDQYKAGAARFSMGEQSNFIAVAIAKEALKLLLKWQPQRIQDYANQLTSLAWKKLLEAGVIMDPDNPSYHMAGLRLNKKHWNMSAVRDKLADRQIAVSQRGDALRVSINVYNEQRDLDALVDTIISMRH